MHLLVSYADHFQTFRETSSFNSIQLKKSVSTKLLNGLADIASAWQASRCGLSCSRCWLQKGGRLEAGRAAADHQRALALGRRSHQRLDVAVPGFRRGVCEKEKELKEYIILGGRME